MDREPPRSAPPPAERRYRLRQWWLDRSVRAKGLIVVAVPLIALAGTAAASLALQYQERSERAVSLAAFTLESAASQVLADAVNAETGVRGYAVTADPLFLAPYHAAMIRIGADRRALRVAAVNAGGVPAQRQADATVGQVLCELRQIRSDVSSHAPAATLQTGLENGKITMDLLRGQITGLSRGPAATVAARRSRINGLESAIDWLTISGLALGLLAGLAGVALFTSGISRRIIAAAVNADLLGQGLPLEPRPRSRDEIGRLARAHRSAEELLDYRAAELTTARDQALQATRAKTMFLSRTSHELRTPLNSILGFAQLLELSELSSEDRENVQYILGAGRHLLALINDVIDIARIESGELSLSIEPVPVAALIEETSQLMRPLAAERLITITRQDGESRLAVRADRRRLSQILVNLISNAVKYNRRGGSITITSRVGSDGRAVIEVADTGASLTEDELDRIFMPFERLGAEQTEIEGTGIGLPLARTLTEAMDGQLAATSTPGQGSVFIISLPRAPDMAPIPASTITPVTAAPPEDPGTGTIDVLYIEDNPANVEVVARYLKTWPGVRDPLCLVGASGYRKRSQKGSQHRSPRPPPQRHVWRERPRRTQGRTRYRRRPHSGPVGRCHARHDSPPEDQGRGGVSHQTPRSHRAR